MKPLVSVIVPVYNVEEYLERCLNSLQLQTLDNIEILLIDDASSDRSGEICESYAKQDKRFKVFHKKFNEGPSAARNLGIYNSISDYLMFVDGDDWVSHDFCRIAYECALNNQADLVMFGYQNARKSIKNRIEYGSIKFMLAGYKTREDAIEMTFDEFGMVVWNKLFDKSLFNNISFPKGYFYEDTGSTYKLIWKANQIFVLDKVLYYYFIRPDSITTRKHTEESLKSWFKMSWQHCRDLETWGYTSDKLSLRLQSIALSYCVKMKRDLTDDNYIIAADILNNVISFPKGLSWERKLLIKLFCISPELFELFCKPWRFLTFQQRKQF